MEGERCHFVDRNWFHNLELEGSLKTICEPPFWCFRVLDNGTARGWPYSALIPFHKLLLQFQTTSALSMWTKWTYHFLIIVFICHFIHPSPSLEYLYEKSMPLCPLYVLKIGDNTLWKSFLFSICPFRSILKSPLCLKRLTSLWTVSVGTLALWLLTGLSKVRACFSQGFPKGRVEG